MTILFVLGVGLIIIGVVLACIDDYDIEDWANPIGWIIAIVGIIMMTWNLFLLLNNGKPKNEVAEVVVFDSSQVQVVPDSIYAVQYIITWKDEDGVIVGNNIKLLGKTEKSVGDTIIVNLK